MHPSGKFLLHTLREKRSIKNFLFPPYTYRTLLFAFLIRNRLEK